MLLFAGKENDTKGMRKEDKLIWRVANQSDWTAREGDLVQPRYCVVNFCKKNWKAFWTNYLLALCADYWFCVSPLTTLWLKIKQYLNASLLHHLCTHCYY
jgi:hypothetical protein